MLVHLPLPLADEILPVLGVRLGVARAGIRKPGRDDLTIIELAPQTRRDRCQNQRIWRSWPIRLDLLKHKNQLSRNLKR
jgi:hypothetical protein